MLGDHVFNRGPEEYNDDEGMRKIFDYKGRLIVDGRTVVGWYVDALVRWNLDTGIPMELLAVRRSDDDLFAICSSCVVTTDGAGSLVINRDGCRISVIPDTAVDEGRCALVGNENIVYSLDHVGRVEAWRVDDGMLLASVEIGAGGSMAMYRDEVTELLVASNADSKAVCLLDKDLKIVGKMTDLPPIASERFDGYS